MNRGNVLLRVDGTTEEGMGRLARCLALANALQRRRYQMTFLSRVDSQGWPERIRRFRHAIVKTPVAAGAPDDQRFMMQEIMSRKPVIMITDSPKLTEETLSLLAAHVPLLISLDESAKNRFPSDLVINPFLGNGQEQFKLRPGAQLVAGARYAMIRSEFRRARTVRSTEPGGPTRVLLALGGGEVGKETLAYAKSLLHQKSIEKVDAVIGVGKQNRDELQALVEEFAGRFTFTADARDLGTRMSKSHLLVTGGGNTALEGACLGIPMMMVTRHDHQKLNATWLEELGVGQYLGAVNKVSASQVAKTAAEILADQFERKAMSRSGRMLIDGRGPDRIVTCAEILLQRSRQTKAMAA